MRKVIRRRIRRQEGGVNVAADVDAVVSVNTGEEGETSRTRVRSRRRIVQRSGGKEPNDPRTEGSEHPREPDSPTEGGE